MQKRCLFFLMSLFCTVVSFAQNADDYKDVGDPIMPVRVKTGRTIFQKDSIPYVQYQPVYVYPPQTFNSAAEWRAYWRLVRDVKRTLPLAKLINETVIETYEYLQTLPNKKAKDEHLRRVERGLKQQYKPRMKRLTFNQGKLLIKLVDRQTNSTGYEIIRAFYGPFRAGLYQTFAVFFGASLKKRYDPEHNPEDHLTERVINLVESGQL